MKLKKLIPILLLTLPLLLQAQQLTRGEYFIDTDPGAGNGTALPTFTVADSIEQTVSLNTTGLSGGFHRVYYRYKYSTGSWGIPEDRLFFIYDTTHPVIATQTVITTGEYFIDTDPGAGNGTAVAAFTAGDSVNQTLNVNTTGLGVDFHRVYYRYKDQNSKWEIPEDRLLYVYDTIHPVLVQQAQIIKGEYFVDTDPGAGNGTALPAFTAADSVNQTFNIVTSGSLVNGSSHAIHVRYQDQNGKWGEAEPITFMVKPCNVDINVTVSGYTLTATSQGTGITYQWMNCVDSTIIAGATNQSYAPASSGNYAVQITDSGCVDTSACNSIIITAIMENVAGNQISVYPNPFTSQTQLVFTEEQQNTLVKIIDLLGNEVQRINFSGKQLTIEKGNMGEGVYFIQIINNNRLIEIKKIVVH